MNSTDLYEAFRSDVSDEAEPYLWGDAEVFRYMNDAYRMFVRLTGGVPDFTSSATRVDIAAGDSVGVHDPSVLRIMNAYRVSDGGVIGILNSTDSAPPATLPGAVRGMVIGAERGKVRWTAVPTVDDVAQMEIYRLPLNRITDAGQEFADVEEDHHLHLLKWMRHLAYQKQDAETFDRAKSDENGAAFRGYCELVTAELDRYKHKTRVVAYGGI